MSKILVKGSTPGMMRVEVEGTDLACEISTALPAYTAVQQLAEFMELLWQAVPTPPAKPSKAPPKGDA